MPSGKDMIISEKISKASANLDSSNKTNADLNNSFSVSSSSITSSSAATNIGDEESLERVRILPSKSKYLCCCSSRDLSTNIEFSYNKFLNSLISCSRTSIFL